MLSLLLLSVGIGAQARSALDVGDAPAPFVPDIEEIHRQNYDRWKAYEDTAKVPAVDNRASGDPHEIWLLPHTHDDVGWLLTPFGYFNMTVTHILTTVTEDLYANPEHRTSIIFYMHELVHTAISLRAPAYVRPSQASSGPR